MTVYFPWKCNDSSLIGNNTIIPELERVTTPCILLYFNHFIGRE